MKILKNVFSLISAHGLDTYYYKYPELVILAGFLVLVILILICVAVALLFKKICSCKRVYYVNPPTSARYTRRDSMEMMELMDLPEPPPPPPTPSNELERVKVLITDEHGQMPSYTLRSRSVDGKSDTYTTYKYVKVTSI
jgi:hypothetical protein